MLAMCTGVAGPSACCSNNPAAGLVTGEQLASCSCITMCVNKLSLQRVHRLA